MAITHQQTITQICYLFEQFGYQHYDEICTQYSHAAQCAGLALQQKLSADTVVAAFLHDWAFNRTAAKSHDDQARICESLRAWRNFFKRK